MAQIIPVEGGFEVWDKGVMVKRFKGILGTNRCVMKRLRG